MTILLEFAGRGAVRIELNATATATKIGDALPFEAVAETWGEEVYFETPLAIAQEKGTRNVDVGDVGWWPPGSAMAIFFGKTPASTGSKPAPASPVTLIGRVVEGLDVLRSVRDGDRIDLSKA